MVGLLPSLKLKMDSTSDIKLTGAYYFIDHQNGAPDQAGNLVDVDYSLFSFGAVYEVQFVKRFPDYAQLFGVYSSENRGEVLIKKLEILFPVAYALFLVILIEWGCQGNKPLSPSRNVSLNIHIPRTNEVKASLLGAVQNEVICRVDGPGSTLLTEATVGPFSTAANYGSEDLTVVIPQADNLLLSLQLNDAASHQPLALGAVGLNLLVVPGQ